MNHNSNTPVSGNTGYVYILTNPCKYRNWCGFDSRFSNKDLKLEWGYGNKH